jgi:hypothetical protein
VPSARVFRRPVQRHSVSSNRGSAPAGYRSPIFSTLLELRAASLRAELATICAANGHLEARVQQYLRVLEIIAQRFADLGEPQLPLD